MAKVLNLRKKALDKISNKIAMFAVQDTFIDERDVQKLLSEAIDKLDEAVLLMVASDEKHQGDHI